MIGGSLMPLFETLVLISMFLLFLCAYHGAKMLAHIGALLERQATAMEEVAQKVRSGQSDVPLAFRAPLQHRDR